MAESSKLLPLEYCRIERAAELLNCKIEDILHWAGIGSISICLYFPVPQNVTAWINRASFEFIKQRTRWIKTATKSVTIGEYSSIDITSGNQWDDAEATWYQHLDLVEKSTSTSCQNIRNKAVEIMARIEGFWRLDEAAITDIYLFPGDDESSSLSDELYLTPAGESSIVVPVWSHMREVQVKDLWIIRRDLELLFDHIKTGGLLARSHQPIESKYYVPHPTAERHAVNRESILAAAIHIKQEKPDECGTTATKWAEALEQHAHRYWNNAQPPLSREKIEQVLSAAMKDGKPHKKE